MSSGRNEISSKAVLPLGEWAAGCPSPKPDGAPMSPESEITANSGRGALPFLSWAKQPRPFSLFSNVRDLRT
jgi:hypothetical protein